jgi:hypothetical protein
MEKEDFKPDTRYTISWRNPAGKVQPAQIYVYRAHAKFMVARMTSEAGVLRRIGYDEVLRVAKESPVEPAARLALPAALLDEKFWRDRVTLEHYASSPAAGK